MCHLNVKKKKNWLRQLYCIFVVHSNEIARRKVDMLIWNLSLVHHRKKIRRNMYLSIRWENILPNVYHNQLSLIFCLECTSLCALYSLILFSIYEGKFSLGTPFSMNLVYWIYFTFLFGIGFCCGIFWFVSPSNICF